MELRWLCFSDLHFKFKNFKTILLRDSLKKYLLGIDKSTAFILIAGDLSYKGESDAELINYIHEIAKISNCINENIFITPGNHDLIRSDDRTDTVKKCVKDSKENNSMKLKDNRLNLLLSDFQPFNEFKSYFDENNGLRSCSLIERDDFRILNINTCLFCYGDEDEGNLYICNDELAHCCSNIINDNKLNIALMHHGINWFNVNEKRNIQ